MIVIAMLWWWKRRSILFWAFARMKGQVEHMESLLYQLTLELDESSQQMYLHRQLQEWIDVCAILWMAGALCEAMRWSYTLPVVLSGLYFSLRILSYVQTLRFNQTILIERLNDFLYAYELSLMRGNHQIKALESANDQAVLVRHSSLVSDYNAQFQKIYTSMKWVVIKKMTLLIERNQHFSSDHLSLEFMEISTELYERYVKGKRLSLERKENAMLIPMLLNMLLMILYIVTPFLLDFIRR